MKSRERILATLLGEKTDRAPYTSGMGMWGETWERWKKESGNPDLNLQEYFGFDEGIVYTADWVMRLGINPWYESEVLEDRERSVIFRDRYGIVSEQMKGHATIPNYLDYPVKDWETWKRFKEERLNPENPQRIPENIQELADNFNSGNSFMTFGRHKCAAFGYAW